MDRSYLWAREQPFVKRELIAAKLGQHSDSAGFQIGERQHVRRARVELPLGDRDYLICRESIVPYVRREIRCRSD